VLIAIQVGGGDRKGMSAGAVVERRTKAAAGRAEQHGYVIRIPVGHRQVEPAVAVQVPDGDRLRGSVGAVVHRRRSGRSAGKHQRPDGRAGEGQIPPHEFHAAMVTPAGRGRKSPWV